MKLKKKRPKPRSGFTQADLAAELGVSVGTVVNYRRRPDFIFPRNQENKEAYFLRVKKWMEERGLPGHSRNGGRPKGSQTNKTPSTNDMNLAELRVEQMKVKIERDLLATERGRKKILSEYQDDLFQAVASVLGKAGQKIVKLDIPEKYLRKIDAVLKETIEELGRG